MLPNYRKTLKIGPERPKDYCVCNQNSTEVSHMVIIVFAKATVVEHGSLVFRETALQKNANLLRELEGLVLVLQKWMLEVSNRTD